MGKRPKAEAGNEVEQEWNTESEKINSTTGREETDAVQPLPVTPIIHATHVVSCPVNQKFLIPLPAEKNCRGNTRAAMQQRLPHFYYPPSAGSHREMLS